MKFKIILIAIAIALTSGCSSNKNNKPILVPEATPSIKPTVKAANSSSTKIIKSEKELPNRVRKGFPSEQKIAAPNDWQYIVDDEKGFYFLLPRGVNVKWQNNNDIDFLQAELPSSISVNLIAYNDRTLNRDELIEDVNDFLQSFEYREIKFGKPEFVAEEFVLHDITFTNNKKQKFKAKLLVGLELISNYSFLIIAEEGKYTANEKMINTIVSNFTMFSSEEKGL